MPVLPKEDLEGIRTRSQRQQDIDQRRFGGATPPVLSEEQPTTETTAAATSGTPSTMAAPAAPDLAALMAMLQEQARRQEEQRRLDKEEQARRQEEQARRLEQQLQQDKEEQARRQEEQARRLEEQLRHDREEQTRRQEEQTLLMKDLHATFGKKLQVVEDQVHQHENRFEKVEARMDDIQKTLGVLKTGGGLPASAPASVPSPRGFKVPPFDGSSSWSAYKIQFEAVVQANGWTKAQAMTALTLGLRDKALTVLEALGKDIAYDQLLEALESRFGDAHLEHVFRAQLKERTQRSSENLQQWALEVEMLVRKAYQSSPALIDGILLQAFVDGIRDLEVRAAVRLGHHESIKDALAHALEVEAVRQDHRSHRIREVTTQSYRDSHQRFSPRCYDCGERGHLRSSCPKRTIGERMQPQERRPVSSTVQQQQGNE